MGCSTSQTLPSTPRSILDSKNVNESPSGSSREGLPENASKVEFQMGQETFKADMKDPRVSILSASTASEVSDTSLLRLSFRTSSKRSSRLFLDDWELMDPDDLREAQELIFKGFLSSFADLHTDHSFQDAVGELPSDALGTLMICQAGLVRFQDQGSTSVASSLMSLSRMIDLFSSALLKCGVEKPLLDHIYLVVTEFADPVFVKSGNGTIRVGGQEIFSNLQSGKSSFCKREWEQVGEEVGFLAWRLARRSWMDGVRRTM